MSPQLDTEEDVALAPGERRCVDCGKAKPFDRFARRRADNDSTFRRDTCCVICRAARRRQRRR